VDALFDSTERGLFDLPEDWQRGRRIILGELRDRSIWFIKLRWFVPIGIAVGTFISPYLGIDLASPGVLYGVALLVLFYNALFYRWRHRLPVVVTSKQRQAIRSFTRWQVSCDYAAMFLLIHFTGGITSPLIFFFIFHIIFASILLRPRSSYGFAALVILGVSFIALAENQGWMTHHPVVVDGHASTIYEHPVRIFIQLCFFSASVLITAASTTVIMTMLRRRINTLVDLSRMIDSLNRRLSGLFSMVQAIGRERDLDRVLSITTAELAKIGEVMGTSIKLMADDGVSLAVKATHGEVTRVLEGMRIELSRSPVSQRVMNGEPFVVGDIVDSKNFQLADRLRGVGVNSVLFVPLTVEGRNIGILGAYCSKSDRFSEDDVQFYRLAAALAAIAIDNALAYEAIERLGKERSFFMMRVAHNLRAPIAAMTSMLDVVLNEYIGPLNNDQKEQLARMRRRASGMVTMVNELLLLTESEKAVRERAFTLVNLTDLIGRVYRTFMDEAVERKTALKLTIDDDLPAVEGDPDALSQLLENLISNALKYTPVGGSIKVEAYPSNGGSVRIQVSDNGIGIPKDALPNLFNEFYRADNARRHEATGTGLGLAIVQRIVQRHGGQIHVESEEGLGSLFAVTLPRKFQGGMNDQVNSENGGNQEPDDAT